MPKNSKSNTMMKKEFLEALSKYVDAVKTIAHERVENIEDFATLEHNFSDGSELEGHGMIPVMADMFAGAGVQAAIQLMTQYWQHRKP